MYFGNCIWQMVPSVLKLHQVVALLSLNMNEEACFLAAAGSYLATRRKKTQEQSQVSLLAPEVSDLSIIGAK